MINICYEQRIGNFFVPNGMPTDVVEEMKRLEDPKYVFAMGCVQEDTNLELPVTVPHHYKNFLELYGIDYSEFVFGTKDVDFYYYVVAPYGSFQGFIGLFSEYQEQEENTGQMVSNFVELIPEGIKDDLRIGKCKILIDGLTEGHPFSVEWIERLHYLIDLASIPRNTIYYLTSNDKYESDYHLEFKESNNLINISSVDYFELLIWEVCDKYFRYEVEYEKYFKYHHKRNKHFMSLNRAERRHRTDLVDFLIDTKLIEKGFVSYSPKELYLDTNFVDVEHLESESHDLMEDISGEKYYRDSYFNIVTETHFYENSLFLSEKIYKPIIYKQPFLVYSSPFTMKHLRTIGYKTFSSIIDESYDLEVDNNKRRKMIEFEIERLCNLPLDELHNLYVSIKNILEYNFDYFINKLDRGMDENIFRICK